MSLYGLWSGATAVIAACTYLYLQLSTAATDDAVQDELSYYSSFGYQLPTPKAPKAWTDSNAVMRFFQGTAKPNESALDSIDPDSIMRFVHERQLRNVDPYYPHMAHFSDRSFAQRFMVGAQPVLNPRAGDCGGAAGRCGADMAPEGLRL